MATTPTQPAVAPAASISPGDSYFEWAPTLAGATLAVAITMVLSQFGLAVGLAVGNPLLENGGASWNVLVAGLWVAWMALASSAAGGYVAGRMRAKWPGFTPVEVEFRDGLHGLIVWALATVVAGLALAAISALSALGAAAATAASEAVTDAEMLRLTANVSTISAFSVAAGSALGAAAAWWAATLGGQHRDENIDVHTLVPALFRKR